MRRPAASPLAFPLLTASLLAAVPARAEVRSVRLVQRGSDFVAGRLDGGLSLHAGELRATRAGVFVSAAVDAGLAFSAIGPHWEGPPGAELSLCVSPDGVRWGGWIAVPAVGTIELRREDGLPNPFAGDTAGALVFVAPGSRYVRYRIRLAGETGSASGLRRIAFHVIDPGPAEPGRPPAVVPGQALPAGGLDQQAEGGSPAVQAPGPPPLIPTLGPWVEKPAIARRAAWGARAPKAAYAYTLAGHLCVHHTASVADFSAETWGECAARVRAIQTYHMDTNGWNDIGYAYLICKHGDVFQGREDDDDTTDVHGAHDGFNRGSARISLLGYFHPPVDQRPADAQVASLVDLIAWIADLRGIDPLGRSLYEAFGAPVDNVYGHREVKATDCPGDHLFALKESLRTAAFDRLARMPL